MAAFRSDPQLMEVATKFVNDVLEKAKEEALRRLKEKAAVSWTLVETTRHMWKWGTHTRVINSLRFTGYYMYHQFNIHKFHVLSTPCVYVFCIHLRTNNDYSPIQD